MKYNNDTYDKQTGEFYTKCCHNCQTHVVRNKSLHIANNFWGFPTSDSYLPNGIMK